MFIRLKIWNGRCLVLLGQLQEGARVPCNTFVQQHLLRISHATHVEPLRDIDAINIALQVVEVDLGDRTLFRFVIAILS